MIAPAGVHAATIAVTTGGDAGNAGTCTLRQAQVALNAGSTAGTNCTNSGGGFGSSDSIDLTGQLGSITLAGGIAIPVGVTTRIAGPGSALLTVSGANASRVFQDLSGGVLLELAGVTVANGLSQGPGGCVYMYDGTVRLEDSVVTGCTAQHDPTGLPYLNGMGGGISAGLVELVQSTVSGNTAATAGGGVSATFVYAYRSVISGNTVSASSCDKYDQSPEYCGTAFLGGGGILGLYRVQVVGSTISGNTVNASFMFDSDDNSIPALRWGLGGGISQVGTFLLIPDPENTATEKAGKSARSPFHRGHAATRGGAAKSTLKATFAARAGAKAFERPKADGSVMYGLGVRDSTISGNRILASGTNDAEFAKYGGGGAFFKYQGENAEIANSTVSGNRLPANPIDQAYSVGSGLLGDSFELSNSTVTGNVGPVAVFAKYNIIGPPILMSTAKSAKSPKLTMAVAAWQSRTVKWRERLGATRTKSFAKAASNPIMNSTIVAGNQGQYYDVVCANCTISGANNLIQFPDGNQPIDTITGVGAKLAPLANRGGVVAGAPGQAGTGPTFTHALYTGSPAIGNGNNLEGFSYDQRGPGFARTIPSGTDIGAFEGSVLAPPDFSVPVPVLGPWTLGLLSALLGAIGLNRRRRRD